MGEARARGTYVAVCAAFFASGATGLLLETLWFRLAGLALGSSTLASALTLSAFMAGLGLGSGVASRIGARVKRPARAYALAEVCVGLVGAGLVLLLPALSQVVAPWLGALGSGDLRMALRFITAFALMLVPSIAMGMTLPLLTQALGGIDPRFGRTLGRLYGYNTLGAVCGVLWAEWQLLRLLGVRGSALVALGLCLFAAGLVALIDRREPRLSGRTDEPAAAGEAIATPRMLLGAAAASGALLLALEVVWLRMLVLFLNDTPRAFALILSLVLAGIALGGLFGGALSGRLRSAERALGPVACATGALCLGSYIVLPTVMVGVLDSAQAPLTIVAVAGPLVFPTSFGSGVLFTLLGAALRSQVGSDAAAAGRLALVNTLGGAAGSLVVGVWLLPSVGVTAALFGLGASYGLLGLVLLVSSDLSRRARYASAALLVLVLSLFPFGDMHDRPFLQASASRWMGSGARVVAAREGRDSTLLYIQHQHQGLPIHVQMLANAYSMSSTVFSARRYMKLYAYFPLAVMERVDRVLVIGFGVGSTLDSLVHSSEPKQIELVDVSEDPLKMSGAIFPDPRLNPLGDPRVKARIEDGRFHLQARDEPYDLITGEPPPPIMAGVTNLYSQEYFELLRSRLTPGDMVTYWLPLKNITAGTGRAIVRAFCEAFEDCSLWHASERDFMLVGTNGLDHAVSAERFERQWRDPRARPELLSLGFERPEQLGALFIGDAKYLRALTRDTPPLTDDYPKRMHQPGTQEELTTWLWELRDTRAAMDRFRDSELIKRLWPERIRRGSMPFFEQQRLINDLLFPGKTNAKQAHVVHAALTRTSLHFPILLLLDSTPDIQRGLVGIDPARLTPVLLLDAVAGQIAARDYDSARLTLSRVPVHPALSARRSLMVEVLDQL